MERKLLYAFRGWIAFVAFMDLGTAFRSYIEKRSFLGDPSDSQYIAGKLIRRRNLLSVPSSSDEQSFFSPLVYLVSFQFFSHYWS